MTATRNDFIRQWRHIFCPAPDVKKRREDHAVTAISEVAGSTIPWVLAAAAMWAMGTFMTSWNVGF